MKMSKQERIGLLIILSVVILALGAFLIVKPAFEEVGVTKSKLESKENELRTLQDKQAKKNPLRDSILQAYDEGAHLADMFFPEMTSYESDDAFREFIQQCKANVVVQQVSVGQPSTATLSATFFNASDVTYALKNYATQGVTATDEETALANRMLAIRTALSGSQTIGASRVDVTVNALTYQDLLQFADEVNEYMRDENGTSVRKAITMDGLMLSYNLVDWLYDALISIDNEYKEALGTAELNRLAGLDVAVPDVTAPVTPVVPGESGEPGDGSGEAVDITPGVSIDVGTGEDLQRDPTIADYVISYSTTITFYSLERMQDPTAQLNAQDGITE